MDLCLFILNANTDKSFYAANSITYEWFSSEINKTTKFICDIYGIWKPWECDAIRSYILDKMEYKTLLLNLSENECCVFSQLFDEDCFEYQAKCFLQSESACFDIETSVVGVCSKENMFHLFVLCSKFDVASFTLCNEGGTNKMSFCNDKALYYTLGQDKDELLKISQQNDFLGFIELVSKNTGLPFALSFDKAFRKRKKYNITEINTLRGVRIYGK